MKTKQFTVRVWNTLIAYSSGEKPSRLTVLPGKSVRSVEDRIGKTIQKGSVILVEEWK